MQMSTDLATALTDLTAGRFKIWMSKVTAQLELWLFLTVCFYQACTLAKVLFTYVLTETVCLFAKYNVSATACPVSTNSFLLFIARSHCCRSSSVKGFPYVGHRSYNQTCTVGWHRT